MSEPVASNDPESNGSDVPGGLSLPQYPQHVLDELAKEEQVPECSPAVDAILTAVTGAADEDFTDNPVAGLVAGDVEALAKACHQLQAELARRLTVAEHLDALPTAPKTVLRQRRWEPVPAGKQLTVARLTARHPDLHQLWANGRVSVDKLHALACGVRKLPVNYRDHLVAALTPLLPALRVRDLLTLLEDWADALRERQQANSDSEPDPDAAAAREQADYDARFLNLTQSQGLWHLTGLLPTLEGETLKAVLDAYAQANRTQGDHKTRGQRLADALSALVGAAKNKDLVPTSHGSSTTAVVTIPLAEVDRLSAGRRKPRLPVPDPNAGPITLEQVLDVITTRRACQTTIGDRISLGDAAAAFALCTAQTTGAIVQSPGTGTDGSGESLGSKLTTALADSRLQPLAMGRTVRLATTAQRTALLLRDRTCSVPGCDVPGTECDVHHVTEWSAGGRTDISGMALLCWMHHREVDLNRWKFVPTPRDRRTQSTKPWTIQRTPRHQWRPRR